MLIFVGISIYNLFYFHWRDRQAACIILLHVAWPQIVPSKSASDHLFFSVRIWTFEATFFGHIQAQLRLLYHAAGMSHRGDERRRILIRFDWKSTSDTRARLESLVVAFERLRTYKGVSIVKRMHLPQKQTPYTETSLPSTIVLLPRDSEQIHVRLDVNVVRYRVDASEWVCDLPVEVPD
jgi:hypothetical protein